MPFARLKGFTQTLRFRLTAWLTAVVFCMVVITSLAVREVVHRALLYEFDQLLVDDTVEVGLAVKKFYPDARQLAAALEDKVQGHSYRDWFVQMFAPDGKLY